MAPTKAQPSTAATAASSSELAPDLHLDSRLALHHRAANWLAIADLHIGYEVERRQSGGLFPQWGMETIADRLRALVADLKPARLILVGDIVDGRAPEGQVAAIALLNEIAADGPELILLRGNHESGAILEAFEFRDTHREGDFLFHHGHRFDEVAAANPSRQIVHVTGHLHPAAAIGDGAGLRLKLPALTRAEVDGQIRYTLPAFSPWAAGGGQIRGEAWLCGEGRVLKHSSRK